MNNKALFSSATHEWETPQDFFDALNEEFNFTLDPCCTHENAKCQKHFTKTENGLSQSWKGETVFCNPPYGRELPQWIEKCYEESLKGATVVMLLQGLTLKRFTSIFIIKLRYDLSKADLNLETVKTVHLFQA